MACASGLARTTRLIFFLRLGNYMTWPDARCAVASMRSRARIERVGAIDYLRQCVGDEKLLTIDSYIKKRSTPI